MHRCSRCQQYKPLSSFHKRRNGGPSAYCKDCKREYDRARRIAGEASDVNSKRRLRAQVFEILGGGRCACCGEDELLFLTLDHKNNDGAADRQKSRDASTAYRRALKEPEHFQILCFNCNCGRHRNGGVCPHV